MNASESIRRRANENREKRVVSKWKKKKKKGKNKLAKSNRNKINSRFSVLGRIRNQNVDKQKLSEFRFKF